MRALVDIYRAHFKTAIALQLQYRTSLMIWLIGMILQPVIFLVIWRTVANSGGGSVGDFRAGDFAAYYITAMMVTHMTFTWIMHEYEYRIRTGQFSPKLLKPIHPIHSDLADNLSYKLLTLVVMIPAAILLSIGFQATFNTQPWAVIAFVPVLLMAIAVRFLLEWTLAMAAFWTTRVNAINQMYFVSMLFLSGYVAPLSLLPLPLQALANLLPFRWFVSFPVELLLGRLTPEATLIGFAAQLIWLVFGITLFSIIWRAGVRRYSGVGI